MKLKVTRGIECGERVCGDGSDCGHAKKTNLTSIPLPPLHHPLPNRSKPIVPAPSLFLPTSSLLVPAPSLLVPTPSLSLL